MQFNPAILDNNAARDAFTYFANRLKDFNGHKPFPRVFTFLGRKFTPEQMLGEVIPSNYQLGDMPAPSTPQRDKPGQQAGTLGGAALELLDACRAEGFTPREGENAATFTHRAPSAPTSRAVPKPYGYASTHFGSKPIYATAEDEAQAKAHALARAEAAGFKPEPGAGPWWAAYDRFVLA